MDDRLIVGERQRQPTIISNYAWLNMYNKYLWIVLDLWRTLLSLAVLIVFGKQLLSMLVVISVSLLSYVLFSMYQQRRIQMQTQNGRWCTLSSILAPFVAHIFQHIRFHDMLVHIDRSAYFVGWLKVMACIPSRTDHIVRYILCSKRNIKQRIIVTNYYIFSKFRDAIKNDRTLPYDPQSLVDYIATIHNRNIHECVEHFYDIQYKDIRHALGQQTHESNVHRLYAAAFLGAYTVLMSLVVMLGIWIKLFPQMQETHSWNVVFAVYCLLDVYVVLVELKHCEFAYHFYHLLTSVQPLQTNVNNDWKKWEEIHVQDLSILYEIMFGYKGQKYALIHCNIHPDIAQLIALYLVSKLPEDGDMQEIQQCITQYMNVQREL